MKINIRKQVSQYRSRKEMSSSISADVRISLVLSPINTILKISNSLLVKCYNDDTRCKD